MSRHNWKCGRNTLQLFGLTQGEEMCAQEWFEIVKKVAKEQKFRIRGPANKTMCSVHIDRWHAAAFQLKLNSAGYLQVHQWECADYDDEGKFGRAVYSIRSYSDCAQFCSILITSASVRAGRDY